MQTLQLYLYIVEESPGLEFAGWFPAGVGIAKSHFTWQEPVFIECDHAEKHGDSEDDLVPVDANGRIMRLPNVSTDEEITWGKQYPITITENYIAIDSVHFNVHLMTNDEMLWMARLAEGHGLKMGVAPPDEESGGRHHLFVDGGYLCLINIED